MGIDLTWGPEVNDSLPEESHDRLLACGVGKRGGWLSLRAPRCCAIISKLLVNFDLIAGPTQPPLVQQQATSKYTSTGKGIGTQ